MTTPPREPDTPAPSGVQIYDRPTKADRPPWIIPVVVVTSLAVSAGLAILYTQGIW